MKKVYVSDSVVVSNKADEVYLKMHDLRDYGWKDLEFLNGVRHPENDVQTGWMEKPRIAGYRPATESEIKKKKQKKDRDRKRTKKKKLKTIAEELKTLKKLAKKYHYELVAT